MSSVPTFDLALLEQRCREAALLACGDAAHDALHLERVVVNARALAKAEAADLRVVMPAIWLHDCVHVPKSSPDRSRASRLCAARAAELLPGFGYPAELLPAVVHAIEAHSWSAGIAPETPEAAVVQDADRLDSIGAVGVARCLMLSAEMRRPLYSLPDPWCAERQPDDQLSAVDHFHTKLLHLAPTFRTAAGRVEAERRTAYLRGFLEQLAQEVDGVVASPRWALAQLNISRLRAPVDSPLLAPFVEQLAHVNALAEAAPGFLWRDKDDSGSSNLANRPFGDDTLINLSLWRDIETLAAFVYRSFHGQMMRRRDEWFHPATEPMLVLWWVPAGHIPSAAEAAERLAMLRSHGATAAAFTLRQRFPPPVPEAGMP